MDVAGKHGSSRSALDTKQAVKPQSRSQSEGLILAPSAIGVAPSAERPMHLVGDSIFASWGVSCADQRSELDCLRSPHDHVRFAAGYSDSSRSLCRLSMSLPREDPFYRLGLAPVSILLLSCPQSVAVLPCRMAACFRVVLFLRRCCPQLPSPHRRDLWAACLHRRRPQLVDQQDL